MNDTPAPDLGAAAAEYADAGLAVFPLRPGSKEPLTANGCHDATRDSVTLAEWWRRWPEANIGVACGPSGIVVIDCDLPDEDKALPSQWAAIDGVSDGRDAFALLWERYADAGWPNTALIETPSGGWHLWFRAHADIVSRNSAGQVAPLVDVRGPGGYVVIPPSWSVADQREYRWRNVADLLPLPDWLARLTAAGAADRRPARRAAPAPGPRAVHDDDAYVAAALRGEAATVANTAKRQRNDALNRAAFNLGTLVGAGRLTRERAIAVLWEAADACGLLTDPDDGPRPTRATILSGLTAGEARPRGEAA